MTNRRKWELKGCAILGEMMECLAVETTIASPSRPSSQQDSRRTMEQFQKVT